MRGRLLAIVAATTALSVQQHGEADADCGSFCVVEFNQCVIDANENRGECIARECADEQAAVGTSCSTLFSPGCVLALARLRDCRSQCNRVFVGEIIRCWRNRMACARATPCTGTPTTTRTPTVSRVINGIVPPVSTPTPTATPDAPGPGPG